VGRKPKISAEIVSEMAMYLSSGNTIECACGLIGINRSTYYEWLKKGDHPKKGDDPLFSEFSNRVKKAEHEAEARNVLIVQNAAQRSWQAAAWWLERRKPNDWVRKELLPGSDLEPTKVEFNLIRDDPKKEEKKVEAE
jgi:hypothetical protein